MTDITTYEGSSRESVAIEVIKKIAPDSDNLVVDAARVMKLVTVQELMRFELITYEEALEHVGLTRQQVHYWKQKRPYLSEAAATLGVQQLDDEITSLLLAARPRAIKRLVHDMLHHTDARISQAAFKILQEHGYRPIDHLVQRVEKDVAKSVEQNEQAARPRQRVRESFMPVLGFVGINTLEDGRRFPSPHEADWNVIEEGEEEE